MFIYVHNLLLMQLPSSPFCEHGGTHQPNTSSSDQKITAVGNFPCWIFCQNACNSFKEFMLLWHTAEKKAKVNITEVAVTHWKSFIRYCTLEAPLPNPFPLPQHFPSAVEAGLRAENWGIISKYLSCVASSMLCYKHYPTREEYTQVAVEIIRKHGWMKSKLGPPTVSIRHLHLNLFLKGHDAVLLVSYCTQKCRGQ